MPLNFFSENAKVEHDYFGVKTDKDIVPQSHLINYTGVHIVGEKFVSPT